MKSDQNKVNREKELGIILTRFFFFFERHTRRDQNNDCSIVPFTRRDMF